MTWASSSGHHLQILFDVFLPQVLGSLGVNDIFFGSPPGLKEQLLNDYVQGPWARTES